MLGERQRLQLQSLSCHKQKHPKNEVEKIKQKKLKIQAGQCRVFGTVSFFNRSQIESFGDTSVYNVVLIKEEEEEEEEEATVSLRRYGRRWRRGGREREAVGAGEAAPEEENEDRGSRRGRKGGG